MPARWKMASALSSGLAHLFSLSVPELLHLIRKLIEPFDLRYRFNIEKQNVFGHYFVEHGIIY